MQFIRRPMIKFAKTYFSQKFLVGAEIGVDAGHNAKDILKCLNIKKLYLVDIWTPYRQEKRLVVDPAKHYKEVQEIFKNNKLTKIIKHPSITTSKLFDNNSLDFVYIDACHTYEKLREDIIAWYPKVRKGGIIGGHDYYEKWLGVMRAVNEFFIKYKVKRYVEPVDWWCIKI